jgi:hypothetical protein
LVAHGDTLTDVCLLGSQQIATREADHLVSERLVVATESAGCFVDFALQKSERVAIEGHQSYQLHRCLNRTEGSDRDDSCLCLRKPERASRDRREGYRLRSELIGDLQSAPIAGGQRLLLPSRSAKPNGSHRVDDPATWEIKAGGRFRIADVAAAK